MDVFGIVLSLARWICIVCSF